MKPEDFAIGRRGLMKGAGSLAAGAVLAAPMSMMYAHNASAATAIGNSPYGPLSPVADLETGLELLQLPPGFSYRSMSWTGDLMSNGQPVHRGHDGMGAIAIGRGRNQRIVLIRNHERSADDEFGLLNAPGVYDANVRGGSSVPNSGGNSNVIVARGRHVETQPSLGGTIRNCAGGQTPWGTWLSCEETIDVNANGNVKHGYVFEVGTDINTVTGNPIIEMGRFPHEAVAVDPATSFVYETEDARNRAGFYKFEPTDTSQRLGSLEQGGKLFMAKVVGVTNQSLIVPKLGDAYDIEWVEIEDPDADPDGADVVVEPDTGLTVTGATGPFLQGFAQGGLVMSRGEGAWTGPDGLIYIVDTSAGVASDGRRGRGEGAVWAYDPVAQRMECIYASESKIAGNNPDNITVSPRGGILLCEDGGGVEDEFGFGERLLGLLPNGQAYPFAKNNIVIDDDDLRRAGKSTTLGLAGDRRRQEWAGACFDPTGRILFVNIQTPGITFAISGPW
ncbi:MAG: alkaline phosphatase PhoX, partial [Pacificimonas sp.]